MRDSSMLFRIKSGGCDIFNQPNIHNRVMSNYGSNKYIRVSSIWLYSKSKDSAVRIDENEVLDSQLTSDQIKFIYADLNSCYLDVKDATYIQNFRDNYDNAQVVNKRGVTLKAQVDGLYGPNTKSPIKTKLTSINAAVVIRRQINVNGELWYFLSTPVECWVQSKYIKVTSYDSVSEESKSYLPETDPSHRNDYGSDGESNFGDGYLQVKARGKVKPTLQDSGVDFINDGDINALIQSAGIYNREDIEWYDKFNRFGCIDPHNNVTTTREYVFFTKPDLHIFNNKNVNGGLNEQIATLALFKDAYYRYRPVLKELQWSAEMSKPFANLLSNSIKSSIDLPGISAEEIDTNANIYGTKMSYRRMSNQSDEAFDFSIEFEDTKYLEVYMFFKLFDEYERRKLWGEITPPDTNYIYRKILHDQISIYKFIVGEDGQSLIYWAKLVGCYPKSVPRDAFSDMSESGGLRLSVQWRAQFVEDMDPQILTDFNTLVYPTYSVSKDLPLYNQKLGAPDGRWAVTPYIAQAQLRSADEIRHRYYLKWRV